MAAPVATKMFLNDIPVQYVRPGEIRLPRGWEPWRITVGVTDDRFDGVQNPVTIRLETVDEFGQSAVGIELEGWNITGKVRHDEYTFDLMLEDVRWNARYQKLTASYNVTWWGSDKLRQGSDDQGVPWTTLGAVEDALERLGLEVDPNPQLDSELAIKELPFNLGPSRGGGFDSVPYIEAMSILAESAELDIVPKPNGHVMVVDRTTDVAQLLAAHKPASGRAQDRDIHWSQPGRLEVLFPKQIERRFEYTEPDPTPRVTRSGELLYDGDLFTNHLENVIPEYDISEFKSTHLEFHEHVLDQVGYDRGKVRARIHVPGIFPWGDPYFMNNIVSTAELEAKFRWFETTMQDTWRSRFRVKQELLTADVVVRPLANLQLGRLAKDGTTKGDGAVFMNYVRVHRYSHYPRGRGKNKWYEALFSVNEGFSAVIPAPFDAQWMTGDVDELIFEVVPKAKSRLDRQYWPGTLNTPLAYGDINDIAAGQPIQALESSALFTDFFQMHVYHHGLQIADIGTAVETERMHRIRFDNLFPGGEGPTLQIKASQITANFAHSEDHDIPRESDIINTEELQAAADYIAVQIGESYASTKQGSLTFGTLQPLADGIQTNGNIYDTVIQFGMDQEFTCTVTYMIMPSIPQVRTGRPLAGQPASKVDGG